MDKPILLVGTRGSKLALVQAKLILNQLRKINSLYEYKINVIKTKGDLDRKKTIVFHGPKRYF